MTRSMNIRNHDELEWLEERSDDSSARRYRKRLAAETGAKDIGCSLYRVPPGVNPWPRHYHLANEEAIYVLAGQGTIWLGAEHHALRAGDYVALPAGNEHAHQILNEGDADLLFLCLSTMSHPDICIYPDSEKAGIFGGAAPGGPEEEVTMKIYLDTREARGYWHREKGE